MLSLLPQLLFLTPLAPTLLRFCAGIVFMYSAWTHAGRRDVPERTLGLAEVVLGALIIAGAWTQAAALIGAITTALTLSVHKFRTFPLSTTLLLLAIVISLVVTGPGAFAFDRPL